MKRIKRLIAEMFKEDLDIQHKLLNLILAAAFCGGILSLIASAVMQVDLIALGVIALLITVVGIGLWIANVKKKPQIAAGLVVLSGNMVLFPIMYFTGGGMMSGIKKMSWPRMI